MRRNDGHWDFFIHNGNGIPQGACFPTKSTTKCTYQSTDYYFDDLLVCYSDNCGQVLARPNLD
jgi:hypothetical protein